MRHRTMDSGFSLPLEMPPRRRHSHGLTPESDDVYEAVLYLRRSGFRVYRAGDSHHNVNGMRMDWAQLLEFASFHKGMP